jgi:hypothetical protein
VGFPEDFDGGEHVYRVHLIYVQLVTDPVIMPAKKEHGCDSGSESLGKRLHNHQHIIFSDESRFSLRFRNGCYRVYRRRGERFTYQCVYESDRFEGGSVMVWAGIYHDGRSEG